MRPTLNKSKGIVKIRIPLPNGSSQDVANADQFTKRRERFGSFVSQTWCSSSNPSEQILDHEATGEFRNHQIGKRKYQYSREWYQDGKKLQLFNAINGQPQTCKRIAQLYAAAARHKNIAETLIRRSKRSAALALTEQARAIKSSADIALPPKKLTGSEFWAAVVQAPADISTPSENHPGRESATSIQNPTNPIPPQTRARKDFWAVCSN
ncbi:hypothetical protein ACHAPG_010943 [Botrytis cinerea]